MGKSQRKQEKRKKRTVVVISNDSPATGYQKHGGLSERALKAYADLTVRDSRFKILYLIPHPPQDEREASPLGWYTPGLHESAGPLMTAAALPRDIRELYSAPNLFLQQRLARRIWSSVFPIQLDVLIAETGLPDVPFRVFMTNSSIVANEIDKFISQSGWPCLHVSSMAGDGRVLVGDFNLSILSDYCKKVVEVLSSVPEWGAFASFAKTVIGNEHIRKALAHQLPRGLHNVTTPNELALEAFGWKLGRVDRISIPLTRVGSNHQRYVDRICRSADAVMAARAQLMKKLSPAMLDYRYIVAVQSLHWGHFNTWRKRISNYKGTDRDAFKFAYSLAVQATSYFDEIFVGNKDHTNSKTFQSVQSQRAADGLSFTAGLTALATASLAPVLRLEPKLNQVRGDLKQLASCARTDAQHHFDWKLSRMANRLSEKMRSLVNPSFLARIDKQEQHDTIEGMKLVADIPLELMRSRGLSLSMRFDTSRLPVLPGNLYLMNCLMSPVVLPLSAFSEVLVIRSFQPDDPLREVLKESITAVLEKRPKPTLTVKIRFVDILNADELVDALNGYNGAMMIFDGHGRYNNKIGAGTIVIGGKEVNAWELKKRCSFPPIVVFSACDTQPLDGSHSSIATGAFVLGAHTVLGTTLPISGRNAGVFMGRLLLRISEFMPLAVKYRSIFTWREVISGMLRMSHVSEVIAALKKNAGLIYQGIDFDDIQLSANMAINERSPDWYGKFLVEFSTLTKQTVDELKRDIDSWASMTDSMKYVQLGNPESIVIAEYHAAEIYQEEVNIAEKNSGLTQSPATT